jgi:hypothetical protein
MRTVVASVLPCLASGDMINAIDGTHVSTADELKTALADHEPVDVIALAWTDSAGRASRRPKGRDRPRGLAALPPLPFSAFGPAQVAPRVGPRAARLPSALFCSGVTGRDSSTHCSSACLATAVSQPVAEVAPSVLARPPRPPTAPSEHVRNRTPRPMASLRRGCKSWILNPRGKANCAFATCESVLVLVDEATSRWKPARLYVSLHPNTVSPVKPTG